MQTGPPKPISNTNTVIPSVRNSSAPFRASRHLKIQCTILLVLLSAITYTSTILTFKTQLMPFVNYLLVLVECKSHAFDTIETLYIHTYVLDDEFSFRGILESIRFGILLGIRAFVHLNINRKLIVYRSLCRVGHFFLNYFSNVILGN